MTNISPDLWWEAATFLARTISLGILSFGAFLVFDTLSEILRPYKHRDFDTAGG